MRDFISKGLLKAIRDKSKSLQFFVERDVAIGIQEAENRMVQWCRNFEGLISSCQPLEKIINSIEFIQDEAVLANVIEYLNKNHHDAMRAPVFTCLGEPSESSSRIMAQLKGNTNYFESMSQAIAHCRSHPSSCIVTVDDLINTGNQFTNILRNWCRSDSSKENPRRSELSFEDIDFVKDSGLRFLFCFYCGMEDGREKATRLIKETRINGQVVIIKQYSSQSGIFGSPQTRYALEAGRPIDCIDGEFIFKGIQQKAVIRFFNICKQAGEQLLRAHKSEWDEGRYIQSALGYGNSARLIITHKNIPPITLTCVWRGGSVIIEGMKVQWQPLFLRREKYFAGSESCMAASCSTENTNPAVVGKPLNHEEIMSRLIAAESDLETRQRDVMAVVVACIEDALRSIILYFYNNIKNQDGIRSINNIVDAICAERNTIFTLELEDLVKIWNQAKIPDVWKDNYKRAELPAIFKSMPLAELVMARETQDQPGSTFPSKFTVKRYFYNAIEFIKTAFPDTADKMSAEYPFRCKSGSATNLPRIEHEFIGRVHEIAQITGLLSPESRCFMVSITGVGGVGKSALALEIAYKCIRKGNKQRGEMPFFDACVWTSAKKEALMGSRVNELLNYSVKSNLNDIVAEVIKVLSPEHYKNLPDFQKQYELARKLLSEKRVLLVVDNMETVDDNRVIAFLKELPSPSKAIITDRRSVQASESIRLMELSDNEAASLVFDQCRLRRVHLSDEQVQDLARKTGGIPLAIIWAVGLMSSKGWGPEEVTRRLANAGDSPVLEFLFSESFKSISGYSQKVLSVLAIPGEAVLGRMLLDWTKIGKTDCEDALSELLEHALIAENHCIDGDTPQDGLLPILDRTFKLLPLTRVYVKNNIALDLNMLRKNITVSLFRMVSDAEDTPDWPSIETINTIERYRGLLSWAMEDAFEREDYRLVTRFMRHIGYSLGIRGYHDMRLHLGNLASDAAYKSGLVLDRALNMIMNIGWVHFVWYNFQECKKVEEEGLQLARQVGDRRLEGIAIRTLALVEKEQSKFSEAETSLLIAKKIFEEVGDSRFLAITLGSLASLRRETKDFASSESYLDEAIRIVKKLKNSEELHTIFLQKLSRLLISQHRTEEAEGINKEAQAILTHLKRQQGVAHCKLNQSLIHEDRGELELALAYAEEAAELFFLFGSKEDIARDLSRIRDKAHKIGIRCNVAP